MTGPAPDLDDSARQIVRAIGVNLTFFQDSSERHMTGLEIALGYLLLQWFAEGLVKGAGGAAGEQIEKKAIDALPGLKTRIKNWFSRPNPTIEGDAAARKELATQAEGAVVGAQQAVAARDDKAVTTSIADAYQQALNEYLKGIGMLSADAAKVARKVREEAQNQVRLPAR
jgi:hypothetical protein